MQGVRQVRLPRWLGAFQVQLTNSFFYISVLNTVLLSSTFWKSWGYEIAKQYAPWMNFWMFLGCGALLMMLLMLMDYQLVYPVRQAFLNEQSCKHENPAMDALNRIEERQKQQEQDMKKVKIRLGVGE